MMILIITSEGDDHEEWIKAECDRRNIETVSLYTAKYPSQISSTQHIGLAHQDVLYIDNKIISAQSITGVLVRRPTLPSFGQEIDADHLRFAINESFSALRGLYSCLDHCNWVNKLPSIKIAELKIYQMNVAQKLGFLLPKTLISTIPADVKYFFNACKENIVQKSLVPFIVSDNDGTDYGLFTTKVNKNQIENMLENVRVMPCYFQELIERQYELRINIVGNYVWTMAIYSNDKTIIDYRSDPASVTYSPIILPDRIKDLCIKLTRSLDLIMSNIDMLVTEDGEYYFLEINPCGQWAWVEQETGLPLCTAIVDQLTGVDTLASYPYIKDNSLAFKPNTAILGYPT